MQAPAPIAKCSAVDGTIDCPNADYRIGGFLWAGTDPAYDASEDCRLSGQTGEPQRSHQNVFAGLGKAEDKGPVEAEIRTFLPAAGGVGATTLALQAASLLHKKGLAAGKGTCVVDLNFQHGSCADYLDIDPQFEIDEIENNPERLDRQLLEVMLSKHASGLNVVAAPHQPSEMRSFKPEVVVRLLDLVSAHFENVVIDMPRIWFPWTETVLLGSNKLYVVADMTVPCIRNAERLVESIHRQIGEQANTGVIVNRYEKNCSMEA